MIVMVPIFIVRLKTTVQLTSSILSFLINTLLIYLILTKSTGKMGNYRHLMVFFCCCSIFFSTMDGIVQPVFHSHKSALFMMMDLKDRSIPVHVASLMVSVMAGCFGVIIYGIATLFIFRYFALERLGRIKYFDSHFLPLWFAVPIAGGTAWTLVSLIIFSHNPTSSEYIRESIRTSFGMDINQTAYIAAVFFPPDHNGEPRFSYQCGLGVLLNIAIMMVPFNIVIATGIKSVAKIKEFPTSDYGKDLQMQLYKALVAQTLIPVFSLFLPFAIIFLCPLFEIDCALLNNSMIFVYALYPVVDPLPIFFFVKSYRNAVARIIGCKWGGRNEIHPIAPPRELTSF